MQGKFRFGKDFGVLAGYAREMVVYAEALEKKDPEDFDT